MSDRFRDIDRVNGVIGESFRTEHPYIKIDNIAGYTQFNDHFIRIVGNKLGCVEIINIDEYGIILSMLLTALSIGLT